MFKRHHLKQTPDKVNIDEDTPNNISPLDNDIDLEGDSLTLISVGKLSIGDIEKNKDVKLKTIVWNYLIQNLMNTYIQLNLSGIMLLKIKIIKNKMF